MPVWSLAAAIIVVLALVYARKRRAVRTARLVAADPPTRPAPRAAPLEGPAPARSRMAAISDVDDPVTATATLVHAVAGPAGWPRIRARVYEELAAVTTRERAGDAIMFAEWAVRQGLDDHHAIETLAGTLCRYLGQKELRLVVALIEAAAAAGGPEAEPYADHAKSELAATAS